MKRILATFLILTQLALQVGIPIHKHFCDMDGAFASVVLKIDHECAEPHEKLPPCCQKEKKAACEVGLQEKDCCSDELEVVKTNVDQVYSSFDWESAPPVASLIHTGSSFIFFTALQERQSVSQGQTYRPPPLFRNGKYIQTLHQIWQI
ncbi:MAG: hypothetical protein NWQ65_06710 [Crocinitomicaceae bacterium]|nr:hypothetical protein [Crocinitomicaceae bacterium]